MVNGYMRFTGNYGACDDEQMKNKTKIPVYSIHSARSETRVHSTTYRKCLTLSELNRDFNDHTSIW